METIIQTNTIMEVVNLQYQKAVQSFEKELQTVTMMYKLTKPEEIQKHIDVLELYNNLLLDFIEFHEIEDFNYKDSFVPDYSWIALNRNNIPMEIDEVVYHLRYLYKYDIITDLNVYHEDEDHLIAHFKITNFKSSAMENFDVNYKLLAQAMNRFLK